ncbi:aspartate aminotransferase family protein [Phenylobacterium montanum]|uniref:Aspartate aminotransferase family protein n=1 Tax=Phenylobacterium montanum TaxID=2823693 RepID=A0A975IWA9_9CAUL|nr:aspartate aminotransferase family protein [Caulobacter sp. S6]QUD88201.1 aspartate aminotransferase family protein [Caulobacter sp. S6]
MTLKNYDIAELRRLDVAHHLPCHQDHKLMQDLGGARIITRAQGSTIFDGEGTPLLDGMAGLWCVQVGYGREELAKVAYDQMLELAYYNTFFKTASPPTVLLATKISQLMGGNLSHVFFNNSGSEAVDTIIRLARYYWQLKGQPERNVLIARNNAYHGSTIAGASLGGMSHMHAQGGPFVPGIEHVMQPYQFNEGFGEDPEAFCQRAVDAIESKILEVGPEKVAAVIGEPIQGAGGVIIPPEGYWPKVEALCRKYGCLLAVDEVICGYGRLGQWFGFHHYGIKPDLVSMAKGLSSGYLPISAVGVADFIVEALRSVSDDFVHGFTYSGHPTAAAVALKNIEIIEREGLVERTRTDTGPYLAKGLAELAKHPLVGEARSVGLIGAVEIVAEKGTNKRFGGKEGPAGLIVRDLCIKHGLMVRAVRDSIVFSPPLVITHAEIDQLVGTIRKALDEALPALKEIKAAA